MPSQCTPSASKCASYTACGVCRNRNSFIYSMLSTRGLATNIMAAFLDVSRPALWLLRHSYRVQAIHTMAASNEVSNVVGAISSKNTFRILQEQWLARLHLVTLTRTVQLVHFYYHVQPCCLSRIVSAVLISCFLPQPSSLSISTHDLLINRPRSSTTPSYNPPQTPQNIDDHQAGAQSKNHSSLEHGQNGKILHPSKALNYSLPRGDHLAVISAHSCLATIQLLSEACHMPVKYSQCQYLLDVECGTSALLAMDILIRFRSTQNTARKVAEHCASLYFFELAALQTIW